MSAPKVKKWNLKSKPTVYKDIQDTNSNSNKQETPKSGKTLKLPLLNKKPTSGTLVF